MKHLITFIAIVMIAASAGAKERLPELKTVGQVDLTRGAGTWYEIARITHWYERGMTGVCANYKLLPNGKMDINTSWRKWSAQAKLKTGHGTGKVADARTNAKLKVTFFWPFYGDYWIMEVGKDYEYAVIGEPARDCLWIFSRSKSMEPEVYSGILERLKEQGYDVIRLEKTQQ